MMKQTLVIFLFSVSILVNAQVPGYLGKRCSLTYSVWAHPAIKEFSDIFGTNNPNDDLSLNLTQAIALDYIVTKRGALCIGFQYAYLGMGYDDYDSSNEYVYKGKDKFPARLISRGLSLGYKLFPKARIAPVGSYIKWDIVGIFNTLKYSTDGVSQNVFVQSTGWGSTSGYKLVPIAKQTVTKNSWGFSGAFSLGRQRVYADRIIIETGVRFAIAVAGEPIATGYGSQFRVTDRVFYNQLVNLRLGIGFLAF